MQVVLDSSVIVAALVEKEEKHIACLKLLEKIKDGKLVALEPYTVLIEVVAAIKRRSGSEELAERVGEDLKNLDLIYFLELVSQRAEQASEIAAKTSLRGMDAVVVQIAEEFGAPLVSLDEEMLEKAKKIVNIKSVDDF